MGVRRTSLLACGLLVLAAVAAGIVMRSTPRTMASPTVAASTGWNLQSTPNPKGAGSDLGQGSQLNGVSCTSPSACTAVGFYTKATGTELTLAERWDGKQWTIQKTPNAAASISVLTSVSCTSASLCTAVGYSYNRASQVQATLAERWSGGKWWIQATPNPSGTVQAVLSAVSCTPTMTCTAVGSYSTSSSAGLTLAERWNSTGWSLDTTPSPSGAYSSGLAGVSCTSTSVCTAVGTYQDSTLTNQVLVERRTASGWSIQSAPNPHTGTGPGIGAQLVGVACPTPSICTAVGTFAPDSDRSFTLAERWHGTTWVLEPTPEPASAPTLGAVSCPTATTCIAVGHLIKARTGVVTLAEARAQAKWTVLPTPNHRARFNDLSGISCTSAWACIAVGSSENGSPTNFTLGERYR
jgi:hypothetical protein